MKPDLTAYSTLGERATWVTLPIQPDTWVWWPGRWIVYPNNLETADALVSAGWENVGLASQSGVALWVLCGQLADIRLTLTEGSQDKDYSLWTTSADRERIEKLPVILAFTVSAEQQKQAIRPGTIKRLPNRPAIPPAQLGEIGVILSVEGAKGHWTRVHISKLSQSSQQLQRRLGAALQRLASDNLERQDWLAQWKEIQAMARDLAHAYWTYLDTQSLQRPHVVNVFKDGWAWQALNMHIQGLHSAIYHKQEWEKQPGMLPFYTYTFSTGYTQTWLQEPGQESINADLASEELTKHLAALGDLEGDIITIQIAQAMAAEDSQAEVVLTPESILEYRGIKPKTDGDGYKAGHRAEDIQAVIDAFERTAWLRLKVWQQIKRRGNKQIEISEQSAYILIESRIYQRTLDENDKGRLIAWHYRMGKWLRPFMDESQAGRYFGLTMKKTLEYDYYRQAWEKRLARYFTVHLCIAAKEGASLIKRHVGKLLSECGIELDQRNPQRSKDRFEKAMHQLAADGMIGDWKYTDDSPLPARQWLDTWLGRSIAVTLGPRALEAYQPMREAAQKRRALPAPKPHKRQGKRSAE